MDEKLIDGLVEDISSSKVEAYELVNNYLLLQQEVENLKVYRNESSKFHVDLNEFLQQRYKEIPAKKYLGRHVVDVAMEYIQQLENEYRVSRTELLEEHITRLEKENKRHKEALDFYANEKNYDRPYDDEDYFDYLPSVMDFDKGEKARRASRGESE